MQLLLALRLVFVVVVQFHCLRYQGYCLMSEKKKGGGGSEVERKKGGERNSNDQRESNDKREEEEVDEAIIMRRFLYSEITCQSHLPDQLE